MKVERTLPIFLAALKKHPDIMTHFHEHFRSVDSVNKLVQDKKFARVLSGVMKMFVDFYSIEESSRKNQKLKSELEQVEKHKAYLLSLTGGNQENHQSANNSDPNRNKNKLDAEMGQLFDHSELGEKDAFFKQMISPRSDSQNYELVYKTEGKKPSGPDHLKLSNPSSNRRNLPTYDIERLQKLADEAETDHKNRKTNRVSKAFKPLIPTTQDARSSSKGRNEFDTFPTMNQRYPSDQRTVRTDKPAATVEDSPGHFGKYRRTRIQDAQDSERKQHTPKEDPTHKLEQKRQEFKRKRSGLTDSESPSPKKPGFFNGESEPNITFEQKMSKYDYSNLRRSRLEDRDSLDKKNKAHNYQSEDEALNQRKPRSISPSPSDEFQARLEKYRQTAPGFYGKKVDKIDTGEVKSRNEKPADQDQVPTPTGNQPSSRNTVTSVSKINTTGLQPNASISSVQGQKPDKKLIPMVPEEEKNDIFAKVQREENRKNRDVSSERNSVNGTSQERARSKGKDYPRLDNKNPGYVPAHLRQQRQIDIDKGLPNLDQIKSSNYGKIDKKSNHNTSKSNLASPDSSKSRGKIGDIRSIVNEILCEGRNRGRPEDTSRFLQNESRIDKSRLKDSINKCKPRLTQRSTSRSAEASEAAVRSEATSETSSANSTTSADSIRWSTTSRRDTSPRETSSSTAR